MAISMPICEGSTATTIVSLCLNNLRLFVSVNYTPHIPTTASHGLSIHLLSLIVIFSTP